MVRHLFSVGDGVQKIVRFWSL